MHHMRSARGAQNHPEDDQRERKPPGDNLRVHVSARETDAADASGVPRP